jgi:threonine/homoserine/homoserine lactone efflux protein
VVIVTPGPDAALTVRNALIGGRTGGIGLAFVALTAAWLTVYTLAVVGAGDVLRRPRVHRAIEGLTGTVLIALGLCLASER